MRWPGVILSKPQSPFVFGSNIHERLFSTCLFPKIVVVIEGLFKCHYGKMLSLVPHSGARSIGSVGWQGPYGEAVTLGQRSVVYEDTRNTSHRINLVFTFEPRHT